MFDANNISARLCSLIIHQIFSLARDWSKHVTWPNIPQLKLGNIREYCPIFKTARVAIKIWRIINTIASILGENMLGYLSLDIICSSKLTVFLELRSRKTVHISEQIMSADKYPSIFSRQMEAIVYISASKEIIYSNAINSIMKRICHTL